MKRLNVTMPRIASGLFLSLIVMVPKMAWAQAAPAPNIRNSPKPWIGIILMIILGMAMVAVSLFPSKRGHQD